MPKKKSKKPKKPKLCPVCQGQGVVVEECMNCMGFRCIECDGEGYTVRDCEHCLEKRKKEEAKSQKKSEKMAAKKEQRKEMSLLGKSVFEHDGLTFAYIAKTDLPNVAAMLAKESVCKFTFFGPNTEQQTRGYFEPLVESIQSALVQKFRPAEHVFTIRKDGKFLGQCALLPVEFAPGNYLIAFQIDDTNWRQGIGQKACWFLIDFAFHVLDARRISGECVKGNIASRKIMEKCGFRLEGCQKKYWNKNGKNYDNLIFGLLKGQTKQRD